MPRSSEEVVSDLRIGMPGTPSENRSLPPSTESLPGAVHWPRVTRGRRAVSALVPKILALIAIGVAWNWLPKALGVKEYIFPTLSEILAAFGANRDLLLSALVATVEEAVVGLLVGALVGMTLGVVTFYVRPIRVPTVSLLVALTSVPLIGLAPVAVFLLGSGLISKMALVALVTAFTVALYTLQGLDTSSREEERLLRAFDASEVWIFRQYRFPSALPQILTGFRFAAAQAVLLAIVGELFSAENGIGAVIVNQTSLAGYDVMWTASVEGALAGLVLFGLATLLARKVVWWER